MAKLSFNLRGYIFQSDIEVLRRSAQTGLTALSNENDTLRQQLEAYRHSGGFEGEYDKEGFLLWERDGVLEHEIASINEASVELRKAFAIAAYHLWERSVRSWSIQEQESRATTAKKLDDFRCLRHEAKRLGYSVDAKLNHVNYLVNILKHNSQETGFRLLKAWPNLFMAGFQRPSTSSDWVSALQMTDGHLNEIFNVIAQSGPAA